ncbi:MAG: hypothetical protein QOF25_2743 [Mycobacterium sp.]|nr:hypothetical protein [Mycobacterium sp.]
MSSDPAPDREAVNAAVDTMNAAITTVAEMSFDALRHPELLTVLDELESALWRIPAVGNRLIARLHAEASPVELGATSIAAAIAERLRISRSDARRRIGDAEHLGPRCAMSGEALAPKLTKTAAAQARGHIGPEHVRIIRKFFDDIPDAVDFQTREQAEANLARVATEHTPESLRAAADRLLALIHPDGDFADADRARRRFVSVGKQGPDGMSKITGRLDPQGRATWDAWQASWAAPGMCNPDDEKPCVDGTPDEATTHADLRSQPQRNHDALTAMGRALLASGQLGQHHGLPATIIVTTTLQDLESGAGQAVTAGGTLLPMRDLIQMASHAHHYLAVFDKHTKEALYLGRSRRCASQGQRIVLYARHRGCTRPGCTASGYRSQVHHAKRDWIKGGQTNIDELTLACKPDNLLIENTSWTTRIRKDGRTEWIPPPHLDTGQARVNDYHHPERYLVDNEDDPDDGGRALSQ